MRRGSRGAASPRVLLALIASTAVTLAVAGPMGYQAYEARQAADRTATSDRTSSDTEPTSTEPAGHGPGSTLPGGPPPAVEGATTTRVPENPEIALGATTTEPGRPATTQRPRPPGSSTTVAGTPSTTARPPVTTTAPPPTTTPLTADGIVWTSAWPSRSVEPLQGAELQHPVIVFVDLPDAVTARFWLDSDPSQQPTRTDLVPPLTLASAPLDALPGMFDPSSLRDGAHSLLVEVALATGATVRHRAQFTVDHG